jgi:hypothetical protein
MANPLNLSQIHHYAYVVDELDAAARRMNSQFGAGPFFYIEQVPVTDVTSCGESAEFIHGAAFGMCNHVPVELMQIARITPERADRRFTRAHAPRIQHVAYVVPRTEVDAVRGELEARGLPSTLDLAAARLTRPCTMQVRRSATTWNCTPTTTGCAASLPSCARRQMVGTALS